MELKKEYQIKRLRLPQAYVLLGIFNELETWKNHYKNYAKLNKPLKYEEYTTLIGGLGSMINCQDYNVPVISEKYCESMLRSFDMFIMRYYNSIGVKDYRFIMCVEECREKLELLRSGIFDV